jgi:hypothetical protein
MQGRRKLETTFTKEILERDYSELGSASKVARKHGVSKKCVLNYMERFGIDRSRNLIPIYKINELAKGGFSSAEIAKELSFEVSGILKAAKACGIEIADKFHSGQIRTHNGYIMVRRPEHPFADAKGYIRVHRLVMEEHLGRILDPSEFVHHINGNKADNRIENLAVMPISDHVRLHHAGKKGRGPDKKPRK